MTKTSAFLIGLFITGFFFWLTMVFNSEKPDNIVTYYLMAVTVIMAILNICILFTKEETTDI